MKDLSKSEEVPYIVNALEQLEELGYNLKRPQAAHLRDGIYELRIKVTRVNFRFFYFFFDNSKIVITHGIKKKTASVPEEEIKKAKEYRSIYYERKGKKR